jgi:hypothetical protein
VLQRTVFIILSNTNPKEVKFNQAEDQSETGKK